MLGAEGTLGRGLLVRARIQGLLENCAVREGAVGPAAVDVGGGGIWLGLLVVGSVVERGGAGIGGCCWLLWCQERMMCCVCHVAGEGGWWYWGHGE